MMSLQTNAYIDGKWKRGEGGTFAVTNPFNNELLAQVTDCTKEDVEEAIDSASTAFKTWSKLPISTRNDYLIKIKDLLLQRQTDLAKVLTQENGKPLKESIGEIGFAASFFQWFAEESRRQYGDVIPASGNNKRSITIRQPIGVAALITPWNFPIGMLGRKVSAALAAGCTVVLKPAEDTPLVALLFAKICQDVGLPAGVVNVVPCSRNRVEEVGKTICESPTVRALSFTGSNVIGQWLSSRCAPTMKRVSLELGGNAPFIVFPSADLDKAVQDLMATKFRNTGQTCVTANRIFVHESVHDEFVDSFIKEMESSLKLGYGLESAVNQGPIINKKQLNRVSDMVNEAVAQGAIVKAGGKVVAEHFYAPTVLTGINRSMQIFHAEIFGPVATICKFRTEEEVITQANDSKAGLAAFFCTTDLNQAWRVAEQLESGMIGINEPAISHCEAPFGGVKFSGHGKEGSRHGLDEYTDLKYICFGIN